MFLESARGWYDFLPAAFDRQGSILPMNIDVSAWSAGLGYSRSQLNDPATNILAGARILSGIQANVSSGNIRVIGTLYNRLGASTVTDYGARFGAIYSIRQWTLP